MSIIEKVAQNLGMEPADLRKQLAAELAAAPAEKKDEPTLEQKVTELADEIAGLKADMATEKAVPPGINPDDEEDADKKGKYPPGKKAKADAADEADDDEEKAAEKADVEKSAQAALPWPKDMASQEFRKGSVEKRDPARDWGADPWNA